VYAAPVLAVPIRSGVLCPVQLLFAEDSDATEAYILLLGTLRLYRKRPIVATTDEPRNSIVAPLDVAAAAAHGYTPARRNCCATAAAACARATHAARSHRSQRRSAARLHRPSAACSWGACVALVVPGESAGLLALAPHAVRCFSAIAAAAEVVLLCVPRVAYSPAMLYVDVKERMSIGSVPLADLFQAVLRKDGHARTDHELNMLCDLFRIVPGFHGIHVSERRAACRMLRLISLPPATTVCHQGAPIGSSFAVLTMLALTMAATVVTQVQTTTRSG
jgi:hypothetical protein